MPIGPYPDFDSCVLDQKKKGKSEDSAKKICGALEQEAKLKGAGLFADFDSLENKDGDLYLKYFLADDTFTIHKWALNLDKINDAIGKPFTKQIPNNLSYLGDGHPWNRLDNAQYEDHLRYANTIKQGEIVDISDVSINAKIKGAGNESKSGRYASIKITDKEIAKLYRENENLIPKAVSIGIWDHDKKTLPYSVIDNYNVVHLAPVEAGAYGPKATLYATCNGVEQKCVNELKGASDSFPFKDSDNMTMKEAELRGYFLDTKTNWDDVTKIKRPTDWANVEIKGASEVTSLVNSDDKNINIMSEQETVNTKNNPTALSNNSNTAQPTPVATNSTASQGTVEIPKQTATQPTATGSPVARLKLQKQTQQNQATGTNNVSNQSNQPIQAGTQQEANVEKDITQSPQFQKLQQEVDQLKAEQAMAIRKEKIARMIPMQLFIDPKGRFDREGFTREVENIIAENAELESVQRYYNLKLDHMNLLNSINNGTQYVPMDTNIQVPQGPEMGVKGASASNEYKTNSEVAELKGASGSDVNSQGRAALKGLRNMIQVTHAGVA